MWRPYVDHAPGFGSDAFVDAMAISPFPAEVPGPHGTFLCQPVLDATLLRFSPPGLPFTVAIPHDLNLIGVEFSVQAACVPVAGTFELTNAIDVALGFVE